MMTASTRHFVILNHEDFTAIAAMIDQHNSPTLINQCIKQGVTSTVNSVPDTKKVDGMIYAGNILLDFPEGL